MNSLRIREIIIASLMLVTSSIKLQECLCTNKDANSYLEEVPGESIKFRGAKKYDFGKENKISVKERVGILDQKLYGRTTMDDKQKRVNEQTFHRRFGSTSSLPHDSAASGAFMQFSPTRTVSFSSLTEPEEVRTAGLVPKQQLMRVYASLCSIPESHPEPSRINHDGGSPLVREVVKNREGTEGSMSTISEHSEDTCVLTKNGGRVSSQKTGARKKLLALFDKKIGDPPAFCQGKDILSDMLKILSTIEDRQESIIDILRDNYSLSLAEEMFLREEVKFAGHRDRSNAAACLPKFFFQEFERRFLNEILSLTAEKDDVKNYLTSIAIKTFSSFLEGYVENPEILEIFLGLLHSGIIVFHVSDKGVITAIRIGGKYVKQFQLSGENLKSNDPSGMRFFMGKEHTIAIVETLRHKIPAYILYDTLFLLDREGSLSKLTGDKGRETLRMLVNREGCKGVGVFTTSKKNLDIELCNKDVLYILKKENETRPSGVETKKKENKARKTLLEMNFLDISYSSKERIGLLVVLSSNGVFSCKQIEGVRGGFSSLTISGFERSPVIWLDDFSVLHGFPVIRIVDCIPKVLKSEKAHEIVKIEMGSSRVLRITFRLPFLIREICEKGRDLFFAIRKIMSKENVSIYVSLSKGRDKYNSYFVVLPKSPETAESASEMEGASEQLLQLSLLRGLLVEGEEYLNSRSRGIHPYVTISTVESVGAVRKNTELII